MKRRRRLFRPKKKRRLFPSIAMPNQGNGRKSNLPCPPLSGTPATYCNVAKAFVMQSFFPSHFSNVLLIKRRLPAIFSPHYAGRRKAPFPAPPRPNKRQLMLKHRRVMPGGASDYSAQITYVGSALGKRGFLLRYCLVLRALNAKVKIISSLL